VEEKAMSDHIYGINGEFRRFTPQEIGLFIRDCRERMGLKRLALAAEVGVSEKTLERAESGEGVSEDTCRRIAVALGLKPESFTGEMFIPSATTAEEIRQNELRLLQERQRTHFAVSIHELRSARNVLALFGTQAFLGDGSNVADEHLQQFTALKVSLAEWNDLALDIPESESLAAAEAILKDIRALEALGYVLKGSVVERYVTGGPYQASPALWRCSLVIAFRKPKGTKDTTPTEARLPKEMLMDFGMRLVGNQPSRGKQ
jgi:transcriptional regulator with XRE-family HTH domain